MWKQTVGLRSADAAFKRRGQTTVLNCQPLLVEDMSQQQRLKFEQKTVNLRKEYDTLKYRLRRMKKTLASLCPWKRLVRNDNFRCVNGEICDLQLDGMECCKNGDRGGVIQCPENYPILCKDGTCSTKHLLCTRHGGLKTCAAGGDCKFLLPTVLKGYAMCKDGTLVQTTKLCKEYGGIEQCPYDRPVMCAYPICNGDYCCEVECSKKQGGPRVCEGLPSFAEAAPVDFLHGGIPVVEQQVSAMDQWLNATDLSAERAWVEDEPATYLRVAKND
jgi:hypothetical protein